jgi:hypothetical protein
MKHGEANKKGNIFKASKHALSFDSQCWNFGKAQMRVVCPYVKITKPWHTQNEKICQNLGIKLSNLEG